MKRLSKDDEIRDLWREVAQLKRTNDNLNARLIHDAERLQNEVSSYEVTISELREDLESARQKRAEAERRLEETVRVIDDQLNERERTKATNEERTQSTPPGPAHSDSQVLGGVAKKTTQAVPSQGGKETVAADASNGSPREATTGVNNPLPTLGPDSDSKANPASVAVSVASEQIAMLQAQLSTMTFEEARVHEELGTRDKVKDDLQRRGWELQRELVRLRDDIRTITGTDPRANWMGTHLTPYRVIRAKIDPQAAAFPTPEWVQFASISAMPEYQAYSSEELRWNDYNILRV
ncbi:unnamed protein product [Peniophora sp. CBMAI 1063]|nr:unnamed protein product [Peniophora sp. CBMAI 1063]